MEVHHHAHTPGKKWTHYLIRNAQGSLATTIDFEKQYKEKAERLLTYLQKGYHLD